MLKTLGHAPLQSHEDQGLGLISRPDMALGSGHKRRYAAATLGTHCNTDDSARCRRASCDANPRYCTLSLDPRELSAWQSEAGSHTCVMTTRDGEGALTAAVPDKASNLCEYGGKSQASVPTGFNDCKPAAWLRSQGADRAHHRGKSKVDLQTGRSHTYED